MTDFLFQRVSEREKAEVKAQSKKIMDDFSKELLKVNKKVKEPLIERIEGEREENKECSDCGKINREVMFENAPEKEGGFIVAERKKW